MAKRLTRREFLKLSGQALAVTGAACAVGGLGEFQTAEATVLPVELDAREIVGRVGDTFATIQFLPKSISSSSPVNFVAKARYGTDPLLASGQETQAVSAGTFSQSESGTHAGRDGSTELIVVSRYKLIRDQWGIQTGDLIYNETDHSTMVVTSVVNDHTIAGTLSGGTRNCWNRGDIWRIDRTYYRVEINLTGLQPSTKYYYKVYVKRSAEAWGAPRPTHSFRTRRNVGESFRFAMWADPHRMALRWEPWDKMLGSVIADDPDFVMDLGDTYLFCNGFGKPHQRTFVQSYTIGLRPRDGFHGHLGVSDVCADRGYFLTRGNHEGIINGAPPKWEQILIPALKLMVPNPNGSTYPQGGSHDSDYDQGYFAYTWGDALFVVLDVVKYKDFGDHKNPERFHIGNAQLSWLQSVLAGSTQKWKFLFMHHVFGGDGGYGRGGATFAFQYEQAQVQALCEQYGVQVMFRGHDHLVAVENANNVLYYVAGLACGPPIKDYSWATPIYPDGYLAPGCDRWNADAKECTSWGYAIVDVTPTKVTIQYKNIYGEVLQTDTVT
jgi:hypothetical protein